MIYIVINLLWVLTLTNYLIPESNNLLWDGPGEAKVADFDPALGVDQDVVGLQVSVHNAWAVDKVNGTKQVIHYCHNVVLWEADALRLIKHIVQAALDAFEDNEDVLFDARGWDCPVVSWLFIKQIGHDVEDLGCKYVIVVFSKLSQ